MKALTRVAVALFLATSATAMARPRLAVVIVVDQLGSESFERRLPTSKHGFARLVKEGHYVQRSITPYAPPVTGPAHATLVTGTTPDVHGIVGNSWYDRDAARAVVAGEDPRYALIGQPPRTGQATAPTQLKVTTLGDALKLASPNSVVVSVAGKARSAILMGGSSADASLWLDSSSPRFTTSTWYGPSLPGWIEPLNSQLAAAALQGFKGPFRAELPRGGFTGERGQTPQGMAAQSARALMDSAAGDEAVLEAGVVAIKSLAMGKDAAPDLLLLGLSRHDTVLHQSGPVSAEAAQAFTAIDVALGRFLEALDSTVGRANYVLVLTGDHGGPPHPDDAKARRIPSGRIDTTALMAKLEGVADAALGPGDYFVGFHNSGFSVQGLTRARLHTVANELRAAARGEEGVLDLVPDSELRNRSAGTLGELYARWFDPQRSPDFVLIPRPYFMFGTTDATTHSSPYLYDRTVPLVLFGGGAKKGRREQASPLEVAPTLARVLEIPPPPAATGRGIEDVWTP